MSQNEPQMSQNEPKNVCKKKFQCDYCEKKFTTIPNKRKHEIHRCKHNTNITSIIEENKQLKKQNSTVK